MNNPYLKIYRGDWFGDMPLRSLPMEARGVWFETMLLMADGTPYGHLRTPRGPITLEQHASLLCMQKDILKDNLDLLTSVGVLSIENDAIVSRRMVRDETLRLQRASGGVLGGNPKLKPKVKRLSTKDNLALDLDLDLDLDLKKIISEYPELNDPSVELAIGCYLRGRSERRQKKQTERGLRMGLKALRPLGRAAALVVIEKATEGGWLGWPPEAAERMNGNGFHGKPKAPYVLPPLQSEFPV